MDTSCNTHLSVSGHVDDPCNYRNQFISPYEDCEVGVPLQKLFRSGGRHLAYFIYAIYIDKRKLRQL